MPELYKMSVVVRLTGFSPTLLRAWERRYGLLKPQRGKGGQRLYTEDDLRVLRRIRQMLAEGRSIGEAALMGRRELLRSAPSEDFRPEAVAEPALARQRQLVLDAVLAVDAAALRRLLDESFARWSPERVVEGILAPVAWRIGELWAQGRCSVASEHLATEMFSSRLRALLEAAAPATGGLLAVAACFPEERHELGLMVVGYQLARLGRRVIHLGPAMPFEELDKALHALHPEALVLSVTLPELYRKHREGLLAVLRRHRGRLHCVVGGQGVPEQDEELTALGATLWPASRPLSELANLLVG
jgi:DNA-binding transcriptional MerR regulator/methylmalonyl-CoA mutase cobalamin-binding subunit